MPLTRIYSTDFYSPPLNLCFEPPKLFRCKATGKIRTWGRMHLHTAAICSNLQHTLMKQRVAFDVEALRSLCQDLFTCLQSAYSCHPKLTKLCESWTTFTRNGLRSGGLLHQRVSKSRAICKAISLLARFGPGKAMPWPDFVRSGTNLLWICLLVLGCDLWMYLGVVVCPRFSGL